MNTITLNKKQVEDLLYEHRYKIEKKEHIAYMDELNIVQAAGDSYGFEVKKDDLKKIIQNIYGSATESFFPDERFNGAVLQIRGDYSIKPEFSVHMKHGNITGKLFVYQETEINKRHRELSNKLVQNKAVTLFPGTDEEYLYEVLTEVTEERFFETIKKQAKDLPIYLVKFDSEGGFTVEEMGKIS